LKTRAETLPSFNGLKALKELAIADGSALSFSELREVLNLTDGNLASITKKLVGDKLVIKRKRFEGSYPLTTYRISAKGRQTIEAVVREFSLKTPVCTEKPEDKK
jgi:DNA-binding MarR family transcriptional regulator